MNQLTRRRETWSPMRELSRLRDQLDEMFWGPFGAAPTSEFFGGWAPPLDLTEDKDKFVVHCDLPGLKKEEIEISVEGNTLTLAGERKKEHEEKGAESHRMERYYGRFQRTVLLPQAVDVNKIQAHYKDGILTVTLPKTEESKQKRIEIKTG